MGYESWVERPQDPHSWVEYRDRGPNGCVAKGRRGFDCLREVISNAPFPICVKHAAEFLRYLHENLAQETVLAAALEKIETYDSGEHYRELTFPAEGTAVVYYLRVGNHIKIGFTTHLSKRIRAYPPDSEVLAYELGNIKLEKARHLQFHHQLRMGQEWFAPSLDLLTHIESVRSTCQI